jgi:hypothetical protein
MKCANPKCGKEFDRTTGRQRRKIYCSDKCRDVEKACRYRIRNPEKLKQTIHTYKEKIKLKNQFQLIGKCANCGNEFLRKRKDKKYCSSKCNSSLNYYKYRDKYSERVSEKAKRKRALKAKPKSSPIYKWCSFCNEEHIKTSKNFYIVISKRGFPAFQCKKQSSHRAKLFDHNKRKVISARWKKKDVLTLGDCYVKEKIQQQIRIPRELIPDKLVELKRTHIKLKRKIYGKERTNTTNSVRTGS